MAQKIREPLLGAVASLFVENSFTWVKIADNIIECLTRHLLQSQVTIRGSTFNY